MQQVLKISSIQTILMGDSGIRKQLFLYHSEENIVNLMLIIGN